MKVLIATPLYPPDDGGPATYARALETALPSKGVIVSLLSFSKFRHYPKIVSHLRYTFALWKLAKDVDIIYTLDLVSAGVPACIVSKLTGKPLVLKMVGDYAWEQGTQRAGVKENLDEFVQKKSGYGWKVWLFRKLQTAVAKHSVKVITPSYYLKGIVCAWGIDPDKIVVVYNSFKANLPKEEKKALREEFGMERPTIISVGRFVPWKGFKVLMDVVAEVQKDIPEVVLEIAGSGDDSEYVAYANKHQYNFVKFLGLVKHDTLMKRIRAADCFALNTGYEGLSHLLLEAMALETPVVTTSVGGNTELFEASEQVSERGVLTDYNDNAALIRGLTLVLTDKKTAQHMAKEAASFVSSFTEQRMITDIVTELKQVVS